MPRILRTPQAEQDLLTIWEYIARQSPGAADGMIRRIDTLFQSLAASPGLGEPQDQYRPGLRAFSVGKYVIFYLPLADGIEVIRVLHGARDLPTVFEGDG